MMLNNKGQTLVIFVIFIFVLFVSAFALNFNMILSVPIFVKS